MPGIPSKDASFVRGTPRNYALTFQIDAIDIDIRITAGQWSVNYACNDRSGSPGAGQSAHTSGHSQVRLICRLLNGAK